jgi:hypothetical protein
VAASGEERTLATPIIGGMRAAAFGQKQPLVCINTLIELARIDEFYELGIEDYGMIRPSCSYTFSRDVVADDFGICAPNSFSQDTEVPLKIDVLES